MAGRRVKTDAGAGLAGREQDVLAVEFNRIRPRLVRVAYAIVGSHTDAEDVVASCWIRLVSAHAREPIEDLGKWCTVAVSHAAIDVLRSARKRREVYVGPWLPEPVLTATQVDLADPADRVTLDDTVSYALLVVLETLTPAERTAWVLHDLFGMPFGEVAGLLGRSAPAVRQLASRARVRVREGAPRVDVDPAEHRAVFSRFIEAAAGGDLEALVATLDPDVVATSDGGGQVSASTRPVRGAERVARFLLGLAQKSTRRNDEVSALVAVNGLPAIGVYTGGALTSLIIVTVGDGHVVRLDLIRAPEKLHAASAGVAQRPAHGQI
jgi:RNA polymerase sigma-70 factor (ECF subfamily)